MERLSKNFIWMTGANIVTSLFGIILFVYLARSLMPEAFGYFSYAFTIVFFLSNFIDLGLSTYGIREVAKDLTRVSDYVSEIVSFRLLISSLLCALFVTASFMSAHTHIVKVLMAESALMLFTFALATEWAFQGIEKMHMVFLSFVGTNMLQVGLIYIFVKGPEDLLKTPVLYFIATLPVITVFLKRLKFKLSVKKADLKKMTFYLSSSLIIWSISMFAQVYNSLDLFILGLFRKMEEVGYFSVARRVIGGVVFLMIFLANAALPRLSSTFYDDIEKFKNAMRKFLKLAIILSILTLLPIIFFSRQLIMLTVGSKYLPVSLPLKIMTAGLVFILLNLPYSTGLIACSLEKEVLKQTIASASLSVVSNFILIPKYGMIGASVSFLLAEALALAWILWAYESKLGKKAYR